MYFNLCVIAASMQANRYDFGVIGICACMHVRPINGAIECATLRWAHILGTFTTDSNKRQQAGQGSKRTSGIKSTWINKVSDSIIVQYLSVFCLIVMRKENPKVLSFYLNFP